MIEQKATDYHFYYKAFDDFNTWVEVYKGKLEFTELIKFKTYQEEAGVFKPNYNGLLVFKDADIRLTADELEKYLEYMIKKKDYYKERFTAIYAQTPNQVVASMLYIEKLPNMSVKFETFSTLEACLNWVDFPLGKKDLIEEFID
jgi:hypothetical protein